MASTPTLKGFLGCRMKVEMSREIYVMPGILKKKVNLELRSWAAIGLVFVCGSQRSFS